MRDRVEFASKTEFEEKDDDMDDDDDDEEAMTSGEKECHHLRSCGLPPPQERLAESGLLVAARLRLAPLGAATAEDWTRCAAEDDEFAPSPSW